MGEQARQQPADGGELCEGAICVRALTEEARSGRYADFVASDETVDGHGEIVKQNWNLERFKKNPVALWSHNSWALPIGKCSNVAVKGGKLECRIHFATAAANPQAELVWQSILEGTLRMVSVGFRPHTVTREVHDDVERYVLDDNELFEISVTPIGSNPNALMKMLNAKALEAARPEPQEAEENDMDLKELQAQFDRTKSELAIAQKDLERATGDLEKANKDLADTREKLTASEKRLAEATARIDEFEAKAQERDVEDLVKANKIKPAQKAHYLKLRQANPELFAEMTADLVEGPETKELVGPDPEKKNTATKAGNGAGLAAAAAAHARS